MSLVDWSLFQQVFSFFFQTGNETKSKFPIRSDFDLLVATDVQTCDRTGVETLWCKDRGPIEVDRVRPGVIQPCQQDCQNRELHAQQLRDILESEEMMFAEKLLGEELGKLQFSYDTLAWTDTGDSIGKDLCFRFYFSISFPIN